MNRREKKRKKAPAPLIRNETTRPYPLTQFRARESGPPNVGSLLVCKRGAFFARELIRPALSANFAYICQSPHSDIEAAFFVQLFAGQLVAEQLELI